MEVHFGHLNPPFQHFSCHISHWAQALDYRQSLLTYHGTANYWYLTFPSFLSLIGCIAPVKQRRTLIEAYIIASPAISGNNAAFATKCLRDEEDASLVRKDH
jgi:hypothetical protein